MGEGETKPGITRQSRQEQQESLYRGIEDKIGIVRGIWAAARELLIPKADDSPETIAEDRKALEAHLEKAKRLSDPTMVQAYERYMQLLPQVQKIYDLPPSKKSPLSHKRGQILEELHQLESYPDVIFLATIDNGISAALQKRQTVRETLTQRGTDPKNYLDVLDFKPTSVDPIREISPAGYSINLCLTRQAFAEYCQLRGATSRIDGSHLPGTIWNIALQDTRTVEERLLGAILGEETPTLFGRGREDQKQRLQVLFSHEDFHSFVEGFVVNPGRIRGRLSKFYGYLIPQALERVNDWEAGVFPYQKSIEDARRLIDRFIDVDPSNEFLAELASKGTDQLPSETYATLMYEKSTYLAGFIIQDNTLQDYIIQAISQLDVEKLQSRLRELFQKVDMEIPERRADVEIAFALFPLSKFYHIEKLVDRWISERSSRSPQLSGTAIGEAKKASTEKLLS